MTTVIKDAGETAAECYDKYKHPHYYILKAFFYFQAARLDLREPEPDIQDATALDNAAENALAEAATYELADQDRKFMTRVAALAPQGLSELPGASGAQSFAEPIAIDSCAVQPLVESPVPIPSDVYVDLGISFHATAQTVEMVEFIFWFQDPFGDRQGVVYSGITNGKFSPGTVVYPRRGLVGYLGRSAIHPSEAVWPLYSGGKAGSAECAVFKARLADGTVWVNHTYDSSAPIQLP